MTRFTYADLLEARAWLDVFIELNTRIQAQNASILEQAERIQRQNERLMDLVESLQEEIDHLRWLDGQDWESFPIQ